MRRAARLSRAIGLSALGLLIATAGALAAGDGVYAGGSPKANRYMDIELQVLPGDRRANWRIDVYGPCTEYERLGRTVGTDAGDTPTDPQLRISGGRFTLRWHAHNSLSNLALLLPARRPRRRRRVRGYLPLPRERGARVSLRLARAPLARSPQARRLSINRVLGSPARMGHIASLGIPPQPRWEL